MRAQQTRESGLGLFLVGAVLGAAVALLYAPENGAESRRRLGLWLHDHDGHQLMARLKTLLSSRHNGHMAVNGFSNARRHGRRA